MFAAGLDVSVEYAINAVSVVFILCADIPISFARLAANNKQPVTVTGLCVAQIMLGKWDMFGQLHPSHAFDIYE